MNTSTATAIKEYSATEAGLAALREKYADITFAVATTEGDKEARAARRELMKLRTSLEDKRKEIKAPALAYAQAIDTEAKRITAEIKLLEVPIDEQIKAEEKRRADEKAERERIEQARISTIRAKIATITNLPHVSRDDPADQINETLADLRALDVTEAVYEEFTEEARAAVDQVIATLDTMLESARAREQEAKRLEEERAALERQRQEQEAANQARAAEEKKLADERAEFERQKAEFAAKQAALQAAEERQRQERAEAAAAQEAARVKAEQEAQAQADREALEEEARIVQAEEARILEQVAIAGSPGLGQVPASMRADLEVQRVLAGDPDALAIEPVEAHTPGRIHFREQGEANQYAMVDDQGHWWMNVLLNGEQMTARQEANMRRLAACWNAFVEVSTDEIESFAARGGVEVAQA